MAAPPARARADYDYLIKLLLIGDSGGCHQISLALYVSLSRWMCSSARARAFVGSGVGLGLRAMWISLLLPVTVFVRMMRVQFLLRSTERRRCCLLVPAFCLTHRSFI